MKTPGILLIETSLEEALAEESRRRTQIDTYRGMKRSFDKDFQIYNERIHDINGLRHVLKRCVLQNRQLRNVKTRDGRISEKTNIGFIHISSHGSKDCLELAIKAGNEKNASERDFVNAFSILKEAKIRALILSACQTGQNGELAKAIIERTGIKAIIGYPENAYDHVCAIAEQLLYFQLLRKKIHIWDAVRRVNDALVLLGEKDRRLLSCWSVEDGDFSGPAPWWEDEAEGKTRTSRSLINSMKDLVPHHGPISKGNMPRLREIINLI